jgi:ketosteroid isomerase-like protein
MGNEVLVVRVEKLSSFRNPRRNYMLRRTIFSAMAMLASVAVLAIGAPASAEDAGSQANINAQYVGNTFGKALAACDVVGAVALYEDDATVIYPGQGQEAKGKADIAKVFGDLCKTAGGNNSKMVSSDARNVGEDYIINVGRWETTANGPDGKPMTTTVRTTELLHNSGGNWKYVVDHASIGAPPPPPPPVASAPASAAPMGAMPMGAAPASPAKP